MRSYMDGYEYEYQCAKSLKKKGFSKINVTRARGDQGIDILAFKEGQTYGIQCKYYSRPVGNKAVQEAFAGAKFYGCDVAAVLTNSTFTPAARELAQKTGVILWEKNVVPRSCGFRVTKWIGVFMFTAGLLGFFLAGYKTQEAAPWQLQIYFGLLTAGGFCNFLECGFTWMEVLACGFYGAAICMSAAAKAGSGISNTFAMILTAFALSLARAVKLSRGKHTR